MLIQATFRFINEKKKVSQNHVCYEKWKIIVIFRHTPIQVFSGAYKTVTGNKKRNER